MLISSEGKKAFREKKQNTLIKEEYNHDRFYRTVP